MSATSRASLDQEIYLRSLTGYLVGRHLLAGFRKVAVLTYPDRICSAMAAAALASYEASGNYRDAAGAVFLLEPGKEDAAAGSALRYGADAVYLSFGGEQKMSDVASLTARAVGALARAGYRGALLVHVRAWLATKQLSSLLSDPTLAAYLRGLGDVRVFTADAAARKFLFNRVRIGESGAALERYAEAEITKEHADLLRISLPPPE
ncbi:hypothetical protein [Conexivisphaera calida]|uniref:hypothetical protein n=1 Tax=Conexivisphaera calida TaxID=1874277 RepID=UPI00157B782A|nr:hypothetical protein [Conexivisphaera calida]